MWMEIDMMGIIRKSIAISLAIILALPISGFCQLVPYPATVNNARLILPAGDFTLPLLKGIRVDPNDPFKFKFIIDLKNASIVDRKEVSVLVEYFLAALTIPEKELWVNLSPYEKDRVIPAALGQTVTGQKLLAQDYLLKQLAASLTYPDSETGKKYWDAVNALAVSHPSFTKVWIIPSKAQVYEHANTVLITEATLKVMTDEDYLAQQNNNVRVGATPRGRPDNNGQAQGPAPTNIDAFKQHILPIIEKDVNRGKNFAQLRQMYSAFILATWFKRKLKDSLYRFYINQGKIVGIQGGEKNFKENIYNRYVASFKIGAYDYNKNSRNATGTKLIKRKYFAGGISAADLDKTLEVVPSLPAGSEQALTGKTMAAEVELDPEQTRINEAVAVDEAKKLLAELLPLSISGGDFAKQFELITKIKSLGSSIVPFLLETLQALQGDREKLEVIGLLRAFTDERAIDALVKIIEGQPTVYGIGLHAALALGDYGSRATPYLKRLLSEHGPCVNIVRAIAQSLQESLVPLLKTAIPRNAQEKKAISIALLELGDRDGLVTFIDTLEAAIKKYNETKNSALLGYSGEIMDILSAITGYDSQNATTKILRADSVLARRVVGLISPLLEIGGNDSLNGIRTVVGLIGCCPIDDAAKALWQFYMTHGTNPAQKRETLLAMVKVGRPAIPYLINKGVENDMIYEMLGLIGLGDSVPFLLKAYREANAKGFREMMATRKVIGTAIEAIGKAAVAPLLAALVEEDNKVVCDVLSNIKTDEVIAGMLEALGRDISVENKRNIVLALGEMCVRGGQTKDFFRKHPERKKDLFKAATEAFTGDFTDFEVMYLDQALMVAATADDLPQLLEFYRIGANGIKNATLSAIARIKDDRALSFLLDTFLSAEESVSESILKELVGGNNFERLKKYFAFNTQIRDRVVERVMPKVAADPKVAEILAAAATPASLQVLAAELSEKARGEQDVDELVGNMVKTGAEGLNLLRERYPHLVAAVEKCLIEKILKLELKSHTKEILLVRALEKWLYFTNTVQSVVVVARGNVINEYFSRREHVADLTARMREYLKQHPDSSYEDIIRYIGADMDNLSPRARVRFQMGAIKYVKDRQKVQRIVRVMEKAKVPQGTLIDLSNFNGDGKSEQAEFFFNILGFVPAQAAVFIDGDAIHIVLDGNGYGRTRYRMKKRIKGNDNYNELSSSERAALRDSTGVYNPTQSATFDGISITGIFTFEGLIYNKFEERDGHTQDHEVQHKFFHSYATDETVDALVYDLSRVGDDIDRINGQSASAREGSAAYVVKQLASNALLRFQDEMMAKIIDGNWAGQSDKDYDYWFNFYKSWYYDDIVNILQGVTDKDLRDKMINDVFARARTVIDQARPGVERLIKAKVLLIEQEEKIPHDAAVKKANLWAVNFLQTIPITRMDRLGHFVQTLEGRLVQKETEVVAPTKDKLGGIDFNGDSLKIKSNGGIKLYFAVKDLARLRGCKGLGYRVLNLNRSDVKEFLR
jgi:hypothetical protein